MNKVIDRVWADPAERDRAKLELLKMQQEGALDELHTQMSAILAEAQSQDPWTSRARPAFMYVIYIMILAALPMGVVQAIHPATAHAVTDGVQEWLKSIPSELWTLFGAGYLGYTGARTVEKRQISASKKGGSR